MLNEFLHGDLIAPILVDLREFPEMPWAPLSARSCGLDAALGLPDVSGWHVALFRGIEYGLIAAAISISIIAVVNGMGTKAQDDV
jgi:hypothetical protein